MATEVPSPELTSSPPVQGWDSQARMATARVAGAQAAPGESAGAELRRGQPAQRRFGRAAFAQARMAAGLGAGPARMASEAAPPDAEPLAPSAAAPQGHWLEVRDCRVAGHVLPLVLLHPRFGIAVCGGPVEAAALVRQRLERARFPAIYPGTLPVLRLPGADSAVERAFGAGPPLALPGGDAWVAMARQALETEVSPALPARVGIRARRRRQRHQLLLAGGLAFLLFGAAGLGVALLLPEQAPPPLAAGPVPPAEAPSAGPPPVPAPAPAMAGLAAPPAAPARPPMRPPVVPAPEAVRTPPPAPAMTAAPPRVTPPAAEAPRQAEALPVPPPAPSPPDPSPIARVQAAPPAVDEARALPLPISAQSIAGAQRCRLITQRIQIGETVADADIRFLQRGCPD